MNITRPSLENILDRLKTAVKQIDPEIDISNNSLIGQILQVVADESDKTYQYAEWAKNQTYVSTAEGNALDRLGGLFEVQRNRGTKPSAIIWHEGALPEKFTLDGSTYAVYRTLTGPYGYFRDSITHQISESQTIQTHNLRTYGPLLISKTFSEESPAVMTKFNAAELNISFVTVEGTAANTEANVEGRRCYIGFVTNGGESESDVAFRNRLKKTSETFGSVGPFKERIWNLIGPCEVIEAPRALPSGQPEHTVRIVFFRKPAVNNDAIASIIRQHRPIGIPSWSVSGAYVADETWDIGTDAVLVIRVAQSVSDTVMNLIERRISETSGELNTFKIAAYVIQNSDIDVLSFTINGESRFQKPNGAYRVVFE